ncbi:MAG TPA: molybdopterin-dependent oxidoreductase [Chloroflexota bacterium]|nr:molybdopterin-dependent oxidoreductase [Chloroflexota bacterium]
MPGEAGEAPEADTAEIMAAAAGPVEPAAAAAAGVEAGTVRPDGADGPEAPDEPAGHDEPEKPEDLRQLVLPAGGGTTAVDRRLALVGGFAAALGASAVMAILRWNLQVRTVPERLLEWMLLYVPLDLFEATIRRFGFDAKRYGLYATIAAMMAGLALLGAVGLWRRWPVAKLLGLALGLWLAVMLVVMPLTSAGFFAAGLVNGTRAAVGGYLAAALTYAGILVLFRELRGHDAMAEAVIDRALGRQVPSTARRPAVLLLGGALVTYAGTFFALQLGPRRYLPGVVVLDPQEPIPSGGVDPLQPHPNIVGGRPAEATIPAGPTEPPAIREIPRDKDGAALPSGRRPGQLADFITSNTDFYIVTKNAGGDPVIDLRNWRLRIDGEVERAVEVDYASLRRLPAVEVTKTLECISNFVSKCELAPFGCDLISTARWKGVRVSDVLSLAGGVKSGAVSLATFAADEFTTALPIDVALAPETLLVYEMNGQVLPREHGYPLRMLVPGRYGMKNAKWVVALRVMNREFIDWYGQRNWSRTAVVKSMSRIDTPAAGSSLPPGEHRIAGIAYAGDRGIAYVEYSADGGRSWHVAQILEQPASRDTWVRWQGRFVVQPGVDTTLISRATDGTGVTQPEPFGLPQPEGSSGWCAIDIRAATS